MKKMKLLPSAVLAAKLMLAAVFLSSCNAADAPTLPPSNLNAGGRQYEIIVIDSCEYIAANTGMSYSMFSHKGNCKFCTARHSR